MEWLMPSYATKRESAHMPALLSVCQNLDRMENREHVLHRAGYRVASASTLIAAGEMTHWCHFDIVLLDEDCARDAMACQLLENCIGVLVDSETSEAELLARIDRVLHPSSSVQ